MAKCAPPSRRRQNEAATKYWMQTRNFLYFTGGPQSAVLQVCVFCQSTLHAPRRFDRQTQNSKPLRLQIINHCMPNCMPNVVRAYPRAPIFCPSRTSFPATHSGLKTVAPLGNNMTTVEPSRKRPISWPC